MNRVRTLDILFLVAAFVALFAIPAGAITELQMGRPDTGPSTLPNQHGMDNMTINNMTAIDVPFYMGQLEYPPVYEANDSVIPWQIWLAFVLLGVMGVGGSFIVSKPEGQLILSVIGLMFSSYSYILSAMVGFVATTYNPQGFLVMNGSEVSGIMVNVIQPVYMVYNPPWLWALVLVLVFASIFGFFNSCYNAFMIYKRSEPPRRRFVDDS